MFSLVVCAASLLTGCTDGDGNRISMQQWWNQHRNKKPAPEPNPPSTDTAEADAPLPSQTADTSDTTPDTGPVKKASTAHEVVRPNGLFVNGEIVSVNDILEPIAPRLLKLAREFPESVYLPRAMQIVRRQIIEEVAQHLIWRRAEQQITDELKPQLEKAVDNMEKDRINREFGGRETVYEKYLTRHGKTREQVRERLRRTVVIDSYLRDQLLPLAPPARRKELLDFYQKHRAEFTRIERREMFLIDIPARTMLDPKNYYAPSTADRRAALKKARARVEQAAHEINDGASFEEAARKYSEGREKDVGGAWGMITAPTEPGTSALQGRWAAPSQRLFKLSSGEVSEVIEDQASESVFLVKCGKIEEGKVLSFKEAQPQIAQALRQDRFMKLRTDFLQTELEKSTLGSLDDFIRQVMSAVPQHAESVVSGK